MAKKIYIRNGVNLDSAITIPGYKSIGYNSDSDTSILSEKNGLGDITEIGGGGAGVSAYKVYTALLSQSGTGRLTSYDNNVEKRYSLVIGGSYEITTYNSNDDFRNVGAASNATGVKFVATGTTPTIWTNKSVIRVDTGAPIVNILENTIGNIWWTYSAIGEYIANSDALFTSSKTTLQCNKSVYSNSGIGLVLEWSDANQIYIYSYAGIGKDTGQPDPSNGLLNSDPYLDFIEIRVYN